MVSRVDMLITFIKGKKMATKALAIKYRPATWEDVTEQISTTTILRQQLQSGEVKNAYLFCGPAGCGKTTCARIFAHDINNGQGNPIELDAASNNGVDDVREIIQQAKTKSLSSEYKIFIIDECHAISNAGWQAMLKIIEEPPAKSIFIFCTTDPQKIPKTILSRVQRYDFQRITQPGITDRLHTILQDYGELPVGGIVEPDAIEYIAKIADGGMRDAITLMDKCLAYSKDLTLDNVVKALGTVDYETMIHLSADILVKNAKAVVVRVEELHANGKDIKQFVKQYLQFLLDIQKFGVGCDWKYLQVPKIEDYEDWFEDLKSHDYDVLESVLKAMIKLNADIKWSSTPKYDLEAVLYMECL